MAAAQKGPIQDPIAGEVLAKLAKKYSAYKSYKATFTRKTEQAEAKVSDQQKGSLFVQGDKFAIKTGNIELFTDGKLLYTYLPASGEVNLTDYAPNPDEITPRDVFTLYKRGYKYALIMEAKDKHGVLVQTIDLEPEDITKDILKVRLIVDKKALAIKRYIIFERGTGAKSTFTIESFVPNAPLPPGTFTYSKARFNGAKLIDLR